MESTIPTHVPGLILRMLVPDDAQSMFNLIDRCRPHLSQFGDNTAQKYQSLEDALLSITNPMQSNRFRFGIWLNGIFVGTINLTLLTAKTAGIGYWVGKEFCGKGMATAATLALSNYALGACALTSIIASTDPENLKSQRVLERAGFIKEELQHEHWTSFRKSR